MSLLSSLPTLSYLSYLYGSAVFLVSILAACISGKAATARFRANLGKPSNPKDDFSSIYSFYCACQTVALVTMAALMLYLLCTACVMLVFLFTGPQQMLHESIKFLLGPGLWVTLTLLAASSYFSWDLKGMEECVKEIYSSEDSHEQA